MLKPMATIKSLKFATQNLPYPISFSFFLSSSKCTTSHPSLSSLHLSRFVSSTSQPSSTPLTPTSLHVFRATKYYEAEETIKKSRFIAKVSPAKTTEEALAFLKRISDPKASHNCFAHRVVNNKGVHSRSSDDGEPSGTAGKPMLGALESENLSETVVVVTRYFGGIELGTGGLSRAYASVARKALRECEKEEIVATTLLEVTVSQSKDKGIVYGLFTNAGAQRISENFVVNSNVNGEGEGGGEGGREGEGGGGGGEAMGDDPVCVITFRIPSSKIEESGSGGGGGGSFIKTIEEKTAGRVRIKVLGQDEE